MFKVNDQSMPPLTPLIIKLLILQQCYQRDRSYFVLLAPLKHEKECIEHMQITPVSFVAVYEDMFIILKANTFFLTL